VVDITEGNRTNLTDAKDPGGRLGPYLDNGLPDLRNLKLYYVECTPGDIVFVVSDGIHDNIDPQTLGTAPAALHPELFLPEESWEDAERRDPKKANAAKTNFRKTMLEQLFCQHFTQQQYNNNNNNNPTYTSSVALEPKDITRSLLSHCKEITSSSRHWMQENPTKKLPNDYVKYPGKMDHVTAIAIKVGLVIH
jgi:hypothetical protein